MARFRNKPTIVEAHVWTGTDASTLELVDWAGFFCKTLIDVRIGVEQGRKVLKFHCPTALEEQTAHVGDAIVFAPGEGSGGGGIYYSYPRGLFAERFVALDPAPVEVEV